MNSLKLLVLIAVLTLPVSAYADCSDAEALSADAYSHARRAYRSDDIDSCQSYAKRAMNAASEAESEASSCN